MTSIPNRNFDLPQPQNGPRGPKNLTSIPLCFFVLFNDCAADGGKHCKNEGLKFSKKCILRCALSFGEKQILETRCIKQHAFLVDPLRDVNGFSNAHTLMFSDLSKRGLKPRKGIEIKVPRRSRPEDGCITGSIPSLKRRKGPRASRPPCMAAWRGEKPKAQRAYMHALVLANHVSSQLSITSSNHSFGRQKKKTEIGPFPC